LVFDFFIGISISGGASMCADHCSPAEVRDRRGEILRAERLNVTCTVTLRMRRIASAF